MRGQLTAGVEFVAPAADRRPVRRASLVAELAVPALRGAAIGALVVTLAVTAIAAQTFHLLGPLGDAVVGLVIVGGPMLLLAAFLRGVGWGVAWLLGRVAGADERSFVRSRIVPALRVMTHPLVSTSIFVAAVLVFGREDGPLSVFSALVPFEIPIGAGALVGLVAGTAQGMRIPAARSATRRRAGTVLLALAVAFGAAVVTWAAFPGFGDPIVRETPGELAAIPQLDLPDPSAPGPFAVEAATYGSGNDTRRPEYGAGVTWTTPPVDASAAIRRPDGIPGFYADLLWSFDTDALPINGLAWYASDHPEPMPVVLIVHGNHAAGDYSDPGYEYLGRSLASHGMFAVSVDENFLNGDAFYDWGGSEMGVRAWMLLRHLDQLRAWNADAAHPLAGRLDLTRVALIGHSRGGEAAALAAAVEQGDFEIAGMTPAPSGFGIRAVVALAPSAEMYRGAGSPVQLTDIDYLVLQGAHDADLPWYEGLRTYHRVTLTGAGDHLKVAAYSERANHGRFNSGWDIGDAGPLASWMLDRGSMLSAAEQEHLARTMVGAFLARSLQGATGYDAFLRDPRAGRTWLPDDVVLTHWQSSGRVEPVALGATKLEDPALTLNGFDDARLADPQLRNASFQGDRALRVEWSQPATVRLLLDPGTVARLDPDGQFVVSLTSADDSAIESPQVVLTDRDGRSASVALGPLRPQLPTRLWKLDALGARYVPQEAVDWPAERFAQTYAVDLAAFGVHEPDLALSDLATVELRFGGSGAAFVDDLAFEPAARAGQR